MQLALLLIVATAASPPIPGANFAPHWSSVEFAVEGGYAVSVESKRNGSIKSFEIERRGQAFEIPEEDYSQIRNARLSEVTLFRSGESYWTVEIPFYVPDQDMRGLDCAWWFSFEGDEYKGVRLNQMRTPRAISEGRSCRDRSQ